MATLAAMAAVAAVVAVAAATAVGAVAEKRSSIGYTKKSSLQPASPIPSNRFRVPTVYLKTPLTKKRPLIKVESLLKLRSY